MICKCSKKEEKNTILEYIGDNYFECPYLYANIHRYYEKNKNIHVWLQKKSNNIEAVILSYYDCVHIYTKTDINSNSEIISFINDNNFHTLYVNSNCVKNFIEKINKKTDFKQMDVFVKKYDVLYSPKNISIWAKQQDIEKITKMMMNDESHYSVYSYDSLLKQLMSRYDEGYGKILYIVKNDDIVSTCAIFADSDKFITIGGIVTNINYRRKGFAETIVEDMCYEYGKMNKNICCLISNEFSKKIFLKMGFEKNNTLTKITILT